MVDCTAENPCMPGPNNRCNGHSQCDGTAYCHPQDSYCVEKEDNGVPCTGHPVCKSDWCTYNDVTGRDECKGTKEVGQACSGHQSVSSSGRH
jgi:hypothetical protein